MPASDLADWLDKQKRDSEKILGDWVEENPQWWAIGLATAVATSMDLGQGLWDALRLGEGAAEGGVKGFGKDALRLLTLAGPLAKGGAIAGRLAQTQMIRLAVTTADVTGPCTFTAVNNAATIAKGLPRNLFILASDAADALGKPLGTVAKLGSKYKLAAWIDDLIPFVTKQGIRLRNLGRLNTLEEVARAAASEDGVVVFAIEWTDTAGKIHRHSMIAVRTLSGVRYADYGGSFIASLSELANRGGTWTAKGGYRIATSIAGKGSAVLFEGMEVIGALDSYANQVFSGAFLLLEGARALNGPSGVELAFRVAPVAAVETKAHEPEVLKASFESFKARKNGKPVMRLPPLEIKGRRNGPPRADYLTGVQYRLNALGFGAGRVDGIKGPKTLRAVKAFQDIYGLDVDGIPGPKTQTRLVEICGF
jgi:hypothetical protein